jgi:flagellar protein FlgJ
MLKPIAAHPAAAMQKDVSPAGLQKLQKACTEFESLLITYMLKSMRSTVEKGGLFGNSTESQIMDSMLDENLALGIAKGGGIGLAKILFADLKDR